MALTFKRFHGSERLSQETTAYDTDVLFNGRPLGSCRNDGHGGEGFFRPLPGVEASVLEQASAWAKTQVYLEIDGSPSLDHLNRPMRMDGIAEYCDYLADRTMSEKRVLATVKRQLKKHALFTDPARGGDVFALKGAYAGDATKAAIEQRYPGAVVLNAVPLEQAVAAFQAQEVRQLQATRAQAQQQAQAMADAVEKLGETPRPPAPRRPRTM